jgi:mannose-1-phosphate guanylyltransferase
MEPNVWAVVLAAGEGTRLKALTTTEGGIVVPKQYCAFGDDRSLLRCAIDRAARIVPPERIVAVVASEHRGWWRAELSDLPQENVLVQPRNKGTAAGILFPVLNVFERDRGARVFVLPSDHYVRDEGTLEESLRETVLRVSGESNPLVLLGMTPDRPDTGYGWIVGGPGEGRLRKVASFVEKPPLSVARDLMARGGLWSSFLFAASAGTLLRLYARALPSLLTSFLLRSSQPASLYESLPVLDFSRHLLEETIPAQWVLSVPPCGWSDLGTPERLLTVRESLPAGGGGSPLTFPATAAASGQERLRVA